MESDERALLAITIRRRQRRETMACAVIGVAAGGVLLLSASGHWSLSTTTSLGMFGIVLQCLFVPAVLWRRRPDPHAHLADVYRKESVLLGTAPIWYVLPFVICALLVGEGSAVSCVSAAILGTAISLLNLFAARRMRNRWLHLAQFDAD